MAQLFTNNAATTLASSALSTDTSLTVVDGSVFPSPSGADFFLLTLASGTPETAWEIVKVTGRATNVLTVVRAQEGTTAQGWSSGVKAELRITAGFVNAIQTGNGASSWTFYDPDLDPASPSALDDEFNGAGAPLGAPWINVNWGSLTSSSYFNGRLKFSMPGGSRMVFAGMQSLPSGDFTVVVKIAVKPSAGDGTIAIIMADGVTPGAGSQVLAPYYNDINQFYICPWTGYNAIGAYSGLVSVAGAKYLRLSRLGTTYTMYYSLDGEIWTSIGTVTPGFTPTHIGFGGQSSTGASSGALEYFRYYNTATPALGGMRTVGGASNTPNALINTATVAAGAVGVVAIPVGVPPGAGVSGVVQLFADYQTSDAIPTMTSDTTPSGVCSASSNLNPVWNMFDKNVSTYMTHDGSAMPAWVQYQFPTAQVVKALGLTPLGGYTTRMPSAWILKGSNDGVTWTDLDTRSGVSGWAGGVAQVFDVTNSTAYTYYRLHVTALSGDTYLTIAELALQTPNTSGPLLLKARDNLGTVKTVSLV